jgi:hypothetical protein
VKTAGRPGGLPWLAQAEPGAPQSAVVGDRRKASTKSANSSSSFSHSSRFACVNSQWPRLLGGIIDITAFKLLGCLPFSFAFLQDLPRGSVACCCGGLLFGGLLFGGPLSGGPLSGGSLSGGLLSGGLLFGLLFGP